MKLNSQKNSVLLSKTRCPKCAERGNDKSHDNLGQYSDGHSYCFSCGYYSGGNSLYKLKEEIPQSDVIELSMPEDISTIIPEIPSKWLQTYGVNPSPIFWSEKEQWLIFPIYIKGDFVAYIARNFKSVPKWLGFGINNQLYYLLGNSSTSSLILVEDIVSAIKISKIHPVMPLFGSHIGLHRWARLKKMGINKIWVWLDYDKRLYALTSALEGQSIGIDVKVIITEKDPKEYNYDQIRASL